MFRFLPVLVLFICSNVSAQTEATIKNDDALIYYRTFGTGSPILIINGGPGMNSDGFAGLAKTLSAKNQTIIYDQRGTGRSKLVRTDASTISMKLMADDMEVLRKHLKIDKWILLGHSFGGMLASYYATLYPEHIQAIILSSSGGVDLGLLSYASTNISSRLNTEETASLNYWNKQIANGDTSHHARLQRGTALAAAYVYNRKYIPIIAERLTQGNPVINQLIWDDLQKIKFDCKPKLSGFNKPVLIIQGKQDIVEERTANRSHEAFKNSSIVLLDKCVHYGWLDAPKEYFTELEKILATNSVSR